jgi:hypothetical protein
MNQHEQNPRRSRSRRILAVGLATVVAAGGTMGALSLYSQANSTETTLSAASWGLEMNGVPVTSTSPSIQIGEFQNLMPGDLAQDQVRFTNKGSVPVSIKLDSSKTTVTGNLVPYITGVWGNGAHDPSSGGSPDWMFPTRLGEDDPDALGPDGFNKTSLSDFLTANNTETVTVDPGKTFGFNFYYQVDPNASAEDLTTKDGDGKQIAKTADIVASWTITQVDTTGNPNKQAPSVDPAYIPMH